MRAVLILLSLSLTIVGSGCGKQAPAESDHASHAAAAPDLAKVVAPKGAKVFFVAPQDGADLKSPVKVQFGVEGMKVQAAGELVDGTGHHHVVIDGKAIELGAVVPKDDKNLHFGKGETEAEIALTPGEHTLTMQFADGAHRSYGPTMAATIKVKISE